jgi:hypothetical protein
VAGVFLTLTLRMKKRLITLPSALLFPPVSQASLLHAVTFPAGWPDAFDRLSRIGLRDLVLRCIQDSSDGLDLVMVNDGNRL